MQACRVRADLKRHRIMPTEPTALSPGSALCQACGLCCSGIWFSQVNLDAGEEEPARVIGLPVEWVERQAQFKQPCVLHDGKGCTTYDIWRPRRCKAYTCAVLDRLEAGELELPAALGLVTVAREMADRVRAEVGQVPGGLYGEVFSALLLGENALPTGAQALSPMSKLDAVALRVYFDRHFGNQARPAPKAAP